MIYSGNRAKEISFPIGGIGTGSFGISGTGRFVDWEIFNRPQKGNTLDYSHIMVKAKMPDGAVVVKALNSDMNMELTGKYEQKEFAGYGFGPWVGTMSGIPHFKKCIFIGEFPIATLVFSDDDFPGEVVLTVFNPFIPLDSYNSSIPAGFFNIEFKNTTDEKIEYSAVFSMRNPFENSINEAVSSDGIKLLKLSTVIEKNNIKYGDICIASCGDEIEIQQYWYRGGWFDCLDVFINEMRNGDNLSDRKYDEPGKADVGSVKSTTTIKPNKSDCIKFIITWNIPNNDTIWYNKEVSSWKNYYATVFESSVESAVYCVQNFDMLYERTLKFKNILYKSTLDETLVDAISSTLSVLKSPTVFRYTDGSFYAWEGVNERTGSCEGTCQHVWNYAYAMCFLFPDLEKSIRDNEIQNATFKNGKTIFRQPLPPMRKLPEMLSCLDGQMGIIIKTYREWKINGDTDWLKSIWPKVKSILNYAWNEENPHKWDFDKDGVLEGRQHHTLDMELFGPSAWLQGFYLCALRAAQEMAEFLGDGGAASEYKDLFDRGYAWTKNNLFNGEYFIQKLNINDKSITDRFECSDTYWYDEGNEIKYQIGDGCEIDQLCGQWHANICGLGRLFDEEQIKLALKSLYKYNFKHSMRDVFNTWRVFALNDEGGAIMCDFPQRKPIIPLPYHSEAMTGFEYALAELMISEGMENEGIEIIKSIRNRYDGEKRNPWNEIECGSNYARAMAAYALIPIYSGFKFDVPNKMIGFNPIRKDNFKCIYSIGTAWGSLEWTNEKIVVNIEEGSLELSRLSLCKELNIKSLQIDDKALEFMYNEDVLEFAPTKLYRSIQIKI